MAGAGGRVAMYDPSGRFLVPRLLPAPTAGRGSVARNGTDGNCGPLPGPGRSDFVGGGRIT